MLLNESIQIKFKNTGTTYVKAGDPIIDGQRSTEKAVFGVAVADVAPGESGLIETSGIFSFDESDIKNVTLYQKVYCYNATGESKAKFSLSTKDGYIFAGISLTNRATEGGPLVLALGYNPTFYKTPTSPSTSSPSGGGAGAMSDTSTTIDPSSHSEPGAM